MFIVQEEPLAGDDHHQFENQVLLRLVLHRPQPALASNRRVSGPRNHFELFLREVEIKRDN